MLEIARKKYIYDEFPFFVSMVNLPGKNFWNLFHKSFFQVLVKTNQLFKHMVVFLRLSGNKVQLSCTAQLETVKFLSCTCSEEGLLIVSKGNSSAKNRQLQLSLRS